MKRRRGQAPQYYRESDEDDPGPGALRGKKGEGLGNVQPGEEEAERGQEGSLEVPERL